jgi:hypothetical protein
MTRHRASLPEGRRLGSILLGSATVLALIGALWALGSGSGDGQPAPAILTTSTSEAIRASTSLAALTSPTTVAPQTTAAPETTLAPETSQTTAPATTELPATTIPSTTTTTLVPLVLEPDGLDVVDFGAGVEDTVAAVIARLGNATADSGWVASRGQFGTCPGTVVRVIRWQSLRLFFGDGPTDFGEDIRHFFYYNQSTVSTDEVVDLATAEDIALGSTVEELETAYGDDLLIESTIPFGVTFTVESTGPGLLSGILTASSPDGLVTAIAGGFGCGA